MDENGLRERVLFLQEQVNRLWEHKASKESLSHVTQDISDIKGSIEAVQASIHQSGLDNLAEQRRQAESRKVDRRWIIGTVLVAAGVVIAAMTLLLPVITGG